MTPTHLRPGFDMIEAVSQMPPDAEEWKAFMTDVMELPLSMLGAVQSVVKARRWRYTNYPLEHLRIAAENWAARRDRLLSGNPPIQWHQHAYTPEKFTFLADTDDTTRATSD